MDGVMKKKDPNDDILNLAKDRYATSVQGWDHIYKAATDDMKFTYDIDDGQWPEGIKAEREKDNRPIITINKILKFVRQVRGDQKQNRSRVKVIPVDSVADPNMAELYNGLIRQIEYLSDAEIAYDTADAHAIASSVGFYRIVTKYADDNGFDQDIFIKRIVNPMSVHFDPAAIEFEMEDAQYCFVEDLLDKKEFKAQYPKATMVDFEGSQKTLFGEWIQGDKVRVAEYFWKEPVKKTIVALGTGEVVELTSAITLKALEELGAKIVNTREVSTHKVMWCKMTGAEILEQSEWPGKDIPIIPVFGDEIVIEGKKYYLSMIRASKDPQRMYSYWATVATETVALAPKNPFIIEHRQIKGFEQEWEEANRKNRMYIRYKGVAGLGKPSREGQTEVPSAIMAMLQQTGFDIEDTLGRYESSKGQTSNERSGVAINARIQQADKGTFTFLDNSTRAKIYCGKQIVDLIPKIYDTERALRVRGENGEEEIVIVNKPTAKGDEIELENDLSVGKYDLVATVGASYGSKRQEMVEMLTSSMQYAPTLAPLIAPLIFKFSDWPGAEEVAEEIKKEVDRQSQMAQQGAK